MRAVSGTYAGTYASRAIDLPAGWIGPSVSWVSGNRAVRTRGRLTGNQSLQRSRSQSRPADTGMGVQWSAAREETWSFLGLLVSGRNRE